MSASYTGALTHKRKADLVEIGEALGIPDIASANTVNDLITLIQSHLKSHEEKLITDDRFRGLYGRSKARLSSDSDAVVEAKHAVESTVKKSRKSVNKAVDRVANAVDPANIALPESPLTIKSIANTAEKAKDAAAEQLAVALKPAQELVPHDVSVQLHRAQSQLVKFTHDSRLRVEHHVRLLQAHLSQPEYLVSAALAVEALFLFNSVVQFYNHTYFFPPAGGEKGTFGSLVHGLFFWLPNFALTVRYPDWFALRPSHKVWPALAWWASTTVLPPFALSTLVSYVPQKHAARTGTRSQTTPSYSLTSAADPVVFALIRLAILLYPLTNAAPSSFVDALEISGNTQVRALGAGLLAALLLVGRLSA